MSDDDSKPRPWLEPLLRYFRRNLETREQVVEALQDAKDRDIIQTETLSMIEGAMEVAEMRVRDIMIPRAHMVVIDRDAPLEQILPIVRESAHSRFPVISDDRSEVVGLLLAKDLLVYCGEDAKKDFDIRDLLRSAVFVPESKRLNVLLNEFRASRSHLAIVVDEYGAAAGVVTIEDVLEQIVGEIEDETDISDGTQILKRGENQYSVKAQTPIEDFNEHFGSEFSDEEFDTIAGLVTNHLGHLPKRDDEIRVDRFLFKVLKADSRKVQLFGLRVEEVSEDGRDG